MKRHPIIEEFHQSMSSIRKQHHVPISTERAIWYLEGRKIDFSLKQRAKLILYRTGISPLKQKFAICGLPRTGTSFIQKLFHNSSICQVEGEKISPFLGCYFDDYVEFIEKMAQASERQIYGFKCMFFHSPNYLDDLLRMQKLGWKLIITHRQDLKAQALSAYLSIATNHFHRFVHKKKAVPDVGILVNMKLLNESFELLSKASRSQQNIIDQLNTNYLQISYSDIKNGLHTKVIAQIATYLNVSAQELQVGALPTWNNWKTAVQNSQEVEDWLNT